MDPTTRPRRGPARASIAAWAWTVLWTVLSAVAPAHAGQVFVSTDVSQDATYGSTISSWGGYATPSGRVVSVVVDPTDASVLYAASEWSGVWKSTDGGRSWQQASQGLRSGISLSAYAFNHQPVIGPILALDPGDPSRLLYLTQPKDGRPGVACPWSGQPTCGPFGGLWTSTDAAASWHHVDLPGCTVPDYVSVMFSGGIAYAFTDSPGCRLLGSADLVTWVPLPDPPFPADDDILVAAPGSQTALFACQRGFVWHTTNPADPSSWQALVVPGGPFCEALAGVPGKATGYNPATGRSDPSSAVLLEALSPDGGQTIEYHTFVADFASSTATELGFLANPFGSGTPGVFVAPFASPPATKGPALSYDVFVSDNLQFWHYHGDGSWHLLNGQHVDPWSMSFPSSYDPPHGFCRAFTATDGGVFARDSGSEPDGGCASNGVEDSWVYASAGLHLAWVDTMAGVDEPALVQDLGCLAEQTSDGIPCPVLYSPTADDDTWVSRAGGAPGSWRFLGAGLGDAGPVSIDPQAMGLALDSRNSNYHLLYDTSGQPPQAGAPYLDITPHPDARGISTPDLGYVTQIMGLPNAGNDPSVGDYLAFVAPDSQGQCGSFGCTDEIVVRNTTAGYPGGTPSAGAWFDISPSGYLDPGRLFASVRAGGGHANPTVYLLTSNASGQSFDTPYGPGQIWKGQIAGDGQVHGWQLAQGSPGAALGRAYNLFVNPYDPNELYATDLSDDQIKVSRDGGSTWQPISTLKDIATNYGEFDFDCGDFANSERYFDKEIFGNQCPLTDLRFLPDHPEIRVATLYPGGVAFSRDGGSHWMRIGVTHAQPFEQPIEMPQSAYYDPTPNLLTGHTTLFLGLEGRGIQRVDGPFPTLTVARIAYCRACVVGVPPAAAVSVLVPSLDQTIPLQLGSDGLFHGDAAFDGARVASLDFQFVVDGQPTPLQHHDVDAAEFASGVLDLSNVPEPAGGALVAVAALALLSRRRRRRDSSAGWRT